jgi:hypothetical protein
VEEVMYDAIAALSPNGEPLLGDAQVILGDGTTKIEFKRGRAKVTAIEAEMLVKRSDVDIPGFTPGDVPQITEPHADGPVASVLPPGAVINGDGTITLSSASLTNEQREAVRQALAIEPVEHETVKPPAGDEAAIEAAREYLAQEGEDVPPEVEKTVTVPEGFEMTTPEGEKRCLARKADGSQCSNAAKGDTVACGLAKHQDQVLAD